MWFNGTLNYVDSHCFSAWVIYHTKCIKPALEGFYYTTGGSISKSLLLYTRIHNGKTILVSVSSLYIGNLYIYDGLFWEAT